MAPMATEKVSTDTDRRHWGQTEGKIGQVNNMAADDLATLGTEPSAMVLT